MENYWLKQSLGVPLFPDIEWEKPERKDLSGKILVVGGSLGSFYGASETYENVLRFGVGDAKVILPESLKKVTSNLTDVYYAETNSTGGFSNKSIKTILDHAQWSDAVLLSGEYGRNSETAVLLASLARSYSGLITITKDAVDILNSEMSYLANREHTLLVCSFSQLQKLGREIKDVRAFKFSDELSRTVEHLHELTGKHKFSIITKHGDYLIAARGGQVITTQRKDLNELWCLKIAASACTHYIQHRDKAMPALATSLLE